MFLNDVGTVYTFLFHIAKGIRIKLNDYKCSQAGPCTKCQKRKLKKTFVDDFVAEKCLALSFIVIHGKIQQLYESVIVWQYR